MECAPTKICQGYSEEGSGQVEDTYRQVSQIGQFLSRKKGGVMYDQDLDFVLVCGVLFFICMVLFGITESIMRSAHKRRRR